MFSKRPSPTWRMRRGCPGGRRKAMATKAFCAERFSFRAETNVRESLPARHPGGDDAAGRRPWIEHQRDFGHVGGFEGEAVVHEDRDAGRRALAAEGAVLAERMERSFYRGEIEDRPDARAPLGQRQRLQLGEDSGGDEAEAETHRVDLLDEAGAGLLRIGPYRLVDIFADPARDGRQRVALAAAAEVETDHLLAERDEARQPVGGDMMVDVGEEQE